MASWLIYDYVTQLKTSITENHYVLLFRLLLRACHINIRFVPHISICLCLSVCLTYHLNTCTCPKIDYEMFRLSSISHRFWVLQWPKTWRHRVSEIKYSRRIKIKSGIFHFYYLLPLLLLHFLYWWEMLLKSCYKVKRERKIKS